MVPGFTGEITEYRGVTGTPRGVNGPSWALVEKGGSKGAVGARPPRPKMNWFGARGPPPPSFFSPSPFPCWTRKGRSPTPSGSRTPLLGRTLPLAVLLLLPPLYTEARGTQYTQVDSLSRVWCPSPQLHTSIISS